MFSPASVPPAPAPASGVGPFCVGPACVDRRLSGRLPSDWPASLRGRGIPRIAWRRGPPGRSRGAPGRRAPAGCGRRAPASKKAGIPARSKASWNAEAWFAGSGSRTAIRSKGIPSAASARKARACSIASAAVPGAATTERPRRPAPGSGRRVANRWRCAEATASPCEVSPGSVSGSSQRNGSQRQGGFLGVPVSLGQGQEHLGRCRCQGCAAKRREVLVHERHVQEQQRQSDRKPGAVRDRSSSGLERFGPVRQLHFGERLQIGAVEPSERLLSRLRPRRR